MRSLFFIVLALLFAAISCHQSQTEELENADESVIIADSIKVRKIGAKAGRGPLLLTRFKSLDELKEVVHFKYGEPIPVSDGALSESSRVDISYNCSGTKISSTLEAGVCESDFLKARDGNFWDKVKLVLQSPYAVFNRRNLITIEHLSRCRPWVFGKGDAAFYDLAERMVNNISDEDLVGMPSEDLSEKGYINTFNHVTAQTFMTSIFSERFADFVADVHERHRMPQLITANFTEEQLADLANGPVDNYIDIINNEWGQELGKSLRKKYSINQNTKWTPELLANYLNDIQTQLSWAFQIAFKPFRPTDDIVINFANKINSVIEDLPESKSYY